MAICSNDAVSYPEDSFENMKRFAKAHDFPFPYLHDGTQTVDRGMERFVRRTSSVTMPTASSSIAARSRKAAQPGLTGGPRELVEAMRAIATTGVAPADQKPSIGCSIKWRTNKAEPCPKRATG